MRGAVERCLVHALERGGGVRYRAASGSRRRSSVIPRPMRCTAPAELSARDPWSCAIRLGERIVARHRGVRVDRRTFVRLLAAVPFATPLETPTMSRACAWSVSIALPFRDPRHAGPLPRARRRRGARTRVAASLRAWARCLRPTNQPFGCTARRLHVHEILSIRCGSSDDLRTRSCSRKNTSHCFDLWLSDWRGLDRPCKGVGLQTAAPGPPFRRSYLHAAPGRRSRATADKG